MKCFFEIRSDVFGLEGHFVGSTYDVVSSTCVESCRTFDALVSPFQPQAAKKSFRSHQELRRAVWCYCHGSIQPKYVSTKEEQSLLPSKATTSQQLLTKIVYGSNIEEIGM
mmetsp:Transcript_29896/g.72454  ORF Transcript_29896/g.72454 Transcript_29896/m.72454 type:complete len:111 (+) Transcript_29896:200-532(+)